MARRSPQTLKTLVRVLHTNHFGKGQSRNIGLGFRVWHSKFESGQNLLLLFYPQIRPIKARASQQTNKLRKKRKAEAQIYKDIRRFCVIVENKHYG